MIYIPKYYACYDTLLWGAALTNSPKRAESAN